MTDKLVFEGIQKEFTRRLSARFLKNGDTINLVDVFEISSYFMAEQILFFQAEYNNLVTWDTYLFWQKGIETTLLNAFPNVIRSSHLEIIQNDTTTLLFNEDVQDLIKLHNYQLNS